MPAALPLLGVDSVVVSGSGLVGMRPRAPLPSCAPSRHWPPRPPLPGCQAGISGVPSTASCCEASGRSSTQSPLHRAQHHRNTLYVPATDIFIFVPPDRGPSHFRAFCHAVPSSWNGINLHLFVCPFIHTFGHNTFSRPSFGHWEQEMNKTQSLK